MNNRLDVLAGLAALIFLGAPCEAAPIFYNIYGHGSGTFNGESFTNRLIAETYVSDTANTQPISDFFINQGGTSTVSVIGLGSVTLLSTARIVASSFRGDGSVSVEVPFGPLDPLVPLGITSADLDGYDLGYHAPVAGFSFSFGQRDATNGALDLSSISGVTFSATGAPVSFVPLPDSLPMLGAALLAMAGIGRNLRGRAGSSRIPV